MKASVALYAGEGWSPSRQYVRRIFSVVAEVYRELRSQTIRKATWSCPDLLVEYIHAISLDLGVLVTHASHFEARGVGEAR